MDGDENKILLHGEVGESYYGDGFTAKDVIAALPEGDVTISVNSGGGNASEGAAIYAALKSHPGKVTVVIEGIAASAASLLAMAADDLVMAEGAMMMIHDPSGVTIGTSEDHTKTAETLDKIAQNYAGIYAERSGKTVEEARTVMRVETWMTAEEAVAAGFADRRTEPETKALAPAFDYGIYAKAPEHLRVMAKMRGWTPSSEQAEADAATRKKEIAMSATPKKADAPEAEVKDVPVKVEAKAEAPTAKAKIDPEMVATMKANDLRAKITARYGDDLTASQLEGVISEAKTPEDAIFMAADLVTKARLKEAGPEVRPSAVVTGDEQERKAEAMIGALQVRMFGGKLEGQAAEYRGMTFKKLAMELSGKPRFGSSETEMVKAGMGMRGVVMGAMTSTSDFTYITTEVMNRQLRAAYTASPATWRQIAASRTAADFRSLYSVQAGVDVAMRKIKENGEYEGTVLTDDGETYKVERYGRTVMLTFEAVVNDDMGAFQRLPGDFARGAANLESGTVWGLINANANMSDGTALFANTAARGRNLAASGGAISVTTVGAAMKAMMEQRPLGAKATGDDFISAIPNILAVPPALQSVARQFTADTTPAADSDTNPYKMLTPIVEPRLGGAVTSGSDTAWYLFDSSLPVIEYAMLDGYEAPRVEAEEKSNPKGVELLAEHMFGAGVVEFRGAYKNAGA